MSDYRYSIRPLEMRHCDVTTLAPHVTLERHATNRVKYAGIHPLNIKHYNKVLYVRQQVATSCGYTTKVVGAIVWRKKDNHKYVMVVRNDAFQVWGKSVPQTKGTKQVLLDEIFGPGATLVPRLNNSGGAPVGAPVFTSGSIAGNKWLI